MEDHGKGFASSANTPNGNAPRGIGLVGMRERVELIGGTLEILHPAEGGTLVRVKIPQDKLQTHAA